MGVGGGGRGRPVLVEEARDVVFVSPADIRLCLTYKSQEGQDFLMVQLLPQQFWVM